MIELAVVLAIISILMGLLLPAVQQARQRALSSACSNNLRQLGLAIHQYHDENRKLPAGIQGTQGKSFFVGWHRQILPYLEQVALAEQAANDPLLQSWISIPLSMQTVVPPFICPAHDRNEAFLFNDPAMPAALTDYLGVSGTNRFRHDGLFYKGSAIRFSEITDGLSSTLALGERPAYPEIGWAPWYTGIWGLEQSGSGALHLGVRELVLPGATLPVPLVCGPRVYHFAPGSLSNACDAMQYWALHPGGGHFLFADGSAKLLEYSADEVLPALATRAGGESLNSSW